ncbi:MAG TPA: enoyl-CoA hydratase/isomerase family protein [Polyangiaceae bacterium]|nr:enoyl-CoA hydratase/isomerase family protein [Polyangiaceae bacterium]
MSESGAPIKTEVAHDGGVLRVVLDQPKGNVLSTAMMQAIGAALDAHRDDKKLKLVTLRGAGGHFSFGASVPEHKKDAARGMLATFHRFVRSVASYPVPIAALVSGRCLGGAFELVLACHYVFATDTAVFGCPEVKLGVLPPVLAVIGHHRLGAPLAERLVTTGADLSAREAEARGLVASLVPPDVDLDAWIDRWYEASLAPLSAFSLREATYAARHGSGLLESLGAPLDAAERRYVERLLPSHDGNEGIEAFLAKRSPQWVNE